MPSYARYVEPDRPRLQQTANVVPWRHLAAPGVVRCKDGALLRSYALRGPDLAVLSHETQGALMWQLNDRFKRLPGKVAVITETQRSRVTILPASSWPHPFPAFIDDVHRTRLTDGSTFENRYFLTLRWKPSVFAHGRLPNLLLTKPTAIHAAHAVASDVEVFRQQADHIAHLLRSVLAQCDPLSTDELLTYLHSTVSDRWHLFKAPQSKIDLDWRLCDAMFVGGWLPWLGRPTKHWKVRLCSITSFPEDSFANALERLDHTEYVHRRVTRWIAHEKIVARGMLRRVQNTWIAQELGPLAAAREAKGRVARVRDTHATNLAADADAARQELSGDYVGLGHFTMTVMTWADTDEQATAQIEDVQRIFEDEGFSAAIEEVHSTYAWRSMIAGDVQSSVRRKPLSTMNYTHLANGFKSAWKGRTYDEHLQAGPWFVARTEDATLFHVVNHVFGVGHILVPGPTGMGKTSLLDFMSTQFGRYAPCQVFRLCVGGGERAMTLASGGHYYVLGAPEVAFQPYRFVDDPTERRVAVEWTLERAREQGVKLTEHSQTFIQVNLDKLAQRPESKRTMTEFLYLLTDQLTYTEKTLHSLYQESPSLISVGCSESGGAGIFNP